jgi:hypothetical protein
LTTPILSQGLLNVMSMSFSFSDPNWKISSKHLLDLNPRLKNLEFLNAKVDYTMILSLGSHEQSTIVVRFVKGYTTNMIIILKVSLHIQKSFPTS